MSYNRPSREGQPGERPISQSARRNAVHFTAAQSDALAVELRHRRLIDVYEMRNGALSVTLQGDGYTLLRAHVTTDGRILPDESTSIRDSSGSEAGPMVLASDEGRLVIGTLIPRIAEETEARPDSSSV